VAEELVARKALPSIAEALTDTRVVTINGARQVGKSTLAGLIARATPGSLVHLLDDPTTMRAATDDPTGFVDHDGLLVIDEIQLAPELFRSIKLAVDTDPRPGRLLLTGSARILALRDLPDALPGRMEIVELWPSRKGRSTTRRTPSSMPPSLTARSSSTTRACTDATTSTASYAAVIPKPCDASPAGARHSSTRT
jgi:hypothetical protein